MTDEELALLEAALRRLTQEGLRSPILIGAAAVQRITERGAGDPIQRITLQIRNTGDLDVVVSLDELDSARRVLMAQGFQLDPRHRREPLRMHAGAVWIDLICRPDEPVALGHSPTVGEVVRWLELHGAVRPADGLGGASIASPAALFVLKCKSWGDRFEDRDLVDLVRIALSDRGGDARRELSAWRGSLPAVLAADITRVRRRFDSPDAAGITAFLRALAPELRRLTSDPVSAEDLRKRAYTAIRPLFTAAVATR